MGDDVVAEEEAGEVAELGEGLDAGLDEGAMARRYAVGEDGLRSCSKKASGVRARRYSPLSHLSLTRSKTGPPREMRSKANVSSMSARVKISAVGLFLLLPCGGGHAAAHEAEEVEQGLGQEAGLAVVDERDGIFALGDFGFVEVAEQRHVPEARELPAEGLVEQDVLGGGGDPLFGADDVGDAHEVVVDDVGEVVGGEAVGLHEDLVVDVVVGEVDVAAELVAEGGVAFGGTLRRMTAGRPSGLEVQAAIWSGVSSRWAPL